MKPTLVLEILYSKMKRKVLEKYQNLIFSNILVSYVSRDEKQTLKVKLVS